MKLLKYLLVLTVVLFAAVYFITSFSPNENKNDKADAAESQTSVSDETPVTAETEAAVEIDNEWAYFLVNKDIPLPEGYKPETTVVYGEKEMDYRAAQYMLKMLEDAKKDGIELVVMSAYRSHEYQQGIFDDDVQRYVNQGYSKEEAYNITADNIAVPGHSEHETGLAADIKTTTWEGEITEEFENTAEFEWLDKNAWKYGYILRYPKDKVEITKYNYEPWHYRFVGLYYAEKIKESGLCLEEFYEQNPPRETAPAETEPPVSETEETSSKVSFVV
ncbi:MAG: M15 family metallopeptidase [Oscillospiraceae bacterium]|nr:M15 family metallopeptidase [Oscillospiraceae bacterium]